MAATIRSNKTSRRRYREPNAEINMIPMIDIMLVLLVIFMVTAPMLQQGVDVDLPETVASPMKGSDEQVVVSIDSSGKVYLGSKNEIPLTELGTKVKAVFAARHHQQLGDTGRQGGGVQAEKVYVKGDRELQYGTIMEVMSVLHKAGIYQIGLVSTSERSSKTVGSS